MSFCLSTCHHGLKTAPDGDCFNDLMNLSIDSADIMFRKFNFQTCNIQDPARGRRLFIRNL